MILECPRSLSKLIIGPLSRVFLNVYINSNVCWAKTNTYKKIKEFVKTKWKKTCQFNLARFINTFLHVQ